MENDRGVHPSHTTHNARSKRCRVPGDSGTRSKIPLRLFTLESCLKKPDDYPQPKQHFPSLSTLNDIYIYIIYILYTTYEMDHEVAIPARAVLVRTAAATASVNESSTTTTTTNYGGGGIDSIDHGVSNTTNTLNRVNTNTNNTNDNNTNANDDTNCIQNNNVEATTITTETLSSNVIASNTNSNTNTNTTTNSSTNSCTTRHNNNNDSNIPSDTALASHMTISTAAAAAGTDDATVDDDDRPPIRTVHIDPSNHHHQTATTTAASLPQQQQRRLNTRLPNGEEMNCKNTLQSFDHLVLDYAPHLQQQLRNRDDDSKIDTASAAAALPDISSLSLPSDLQTLAHTIIGTPVVTTTTTPNNHNNDIEIPIHADAVVAVTTIPQAEVYVIPHRRSNNNDDDDDRERNPNATTKHPWRTRIVMATGVVLLLVIGMTIGITIPIVGSSSSSFDGSKDRSIRTKEEFITQYLSDYIHNISLSHVNIEQPSSSSSSFGSDHGDNMTAEEASLRWILANSVNDPDWISFYERHYDPLSPSSMTTTWADLRQHIVLTQTYVLLQFWFQQKDATTGKFNESWSRTDGWLRNDNDVCTWFGIVCQSRDMRTLEYTDAMSLFWSLGDNRTAAMELDNDKNNDTLVNVVTELLFVAEEQFYTSTDTYEIDMDYAFILSGYVDIYPMYFGIQLIGTIPNDIGLLNHLRVITFDGNFLEGTIPSTLGLLSSLEVFKVAGNYISGSIPDNIRQLTALTHFDVSINTINGTIPTSLTQIESMNRFHASYNQLTGTIPELNWTNITIFDVSYNQMNGTIPMSMQRWTNLQVFLVIHNSFRGSVPTWIGVFRSISVFSIANNNFTGTIPTSIQSWSIAFFIDLSSNNLHGTVPLFLNSPNYINITENNFTGTLPLSKYACGTLQYFSCERNSFIGTIPESCAQAVEVFEVSNNELTGTLPTWIFESSSLTVLHAADNGFFGTIPSGLEGLIMYDFQVQNNMLEGTIPLNIETWIYLGYFDVSGNNLTGTIPSQLGVNWIDFPTILLQNNSFAGNVSETLCFAAAHVEADCNICTCCINCLPLSEQQQEGNYNNSTHIP